MKSPFTKIFFLAVAVCLFSISASAQNVTYLDENYRPANAQHYTYKRVIKYREPIINPNFGTGYYGGITANPTPTGLHVCSLIDYYNTGEPALVVNVLSLNINCTQWAFDGQAIYYYRNGNIKRKEIYKAGKLNGVVISYDEDGNEIKRETYVNGNLIDENRFAASADNPLIGTWKYVEYGNYQSPINGRTSSYVKRTLIVTYYQSGILEVTSQSSYSASTEKRNWKYIPKTATTGIEEDYLGDELIERDNIRWISHDQFEATVIFHQSPSLVGETLLFTRQ